MDEMDYISEALGEKPRKKTGGRAKGTPNKRTQKFAEAVEEHGICLLTEILEIAGDLPPNERAGIYIKLLPFLYPKRKATEPSIFDL